MNLQSQPLGGRSVAEEEELLVSQKLLERGDCPLEEVVVERYGIRCALHGHRSALARDAACAPQAAVFRE
jgi:hypothetical protein